MKLDGELSAIAHACSKNPSSLVFLSFCLSSLPKSRSPFQNEDLLLYSPKNDEIALKILKCTDDSAAALIGKGKISSFWKGARRGSNTQERRGPN